MVTQTALSLTPKNRNFLSPIPFMLLVKKLPNTDYFVQKINLPGISSVPVIQPTPFTNIPQTGIKLKWNPLIVTFKVNEDLSNWQEIFNWLTAINLSEDFTNNAALAINPEYTGLGIKSEMILVIHDDERQPQLNVVFHDAFPLSISDINFDSTKKDVEYITATATFTYTTYTIDTHI